MPDEAAVRIGHALLAGEVYEKQDFESLLARALSGDRDEALAASKSLFRDIVEPLADRFDPELSDRYFSFFGSIVARLYADPRFVGMRRALDAAASNGDRESWTDGPIKRCLVLSRVTLGADVAVSSVVLEGLRRAYPQAELTLACGKKVAELFRGDRQLSVLEVEYPRSGTLAERLDVWGSLWERVSAWAGDGEEYVVVNPDSRMTQLGVLPASQEGRCVWFDSRSYGAPGEESIGELTSRWMGDMFGVSGAGPYVALGEADLEAGRRLRGDTSQRTAAVNWGFGGNADKRVSSEFEAQVVLALLDRGWRVILDKGFGEEEGASAAAVAQAAQGRGELELVEGPISGFAGVIAASDLFVGYDSACGHIAAAIGVPGIDVFKGAVCERMRQRWSPWGKTPAKVVAVDDDESAEATLKRVLELLP